MIKTLLIKLGILKKPKSKSLKCSDCKKEIKLTKENYNKTGILHALGIGHKCRTYFACEKCVKKSYKHE